MQDLVQLQSEEEKWSIVGDWRDVIRIALGEMFRIVRLNQLYKGAGAGRILRLIGVRSPVFFLRIVEQSQSGLDREMLPYLIQFRRGESGALGQHEHGDAVGIEMPFRNHDEVARRI